ncbi:MAG: flagellar filament capping protein FliD, partial [Synergistaceae bacterium]|nr:flagellar filament capping protein FliD [Synergistaceae bacterium]
TGLDKTGALGAVNLTMSNKLYVEIQDPRDPTDPTKKVKNYITYVPKDVNNVLNPYPSQLLSVSSDGRNYVEGVDYSYDPSNGAITWNTLDSSNNEFVTHPADGETIGVYTVYAEAFTRGGGTEDTVQPLPSGTWLGIDSPPQTPPPPLPSSSCLFTVIDENGKKYTGAYAPDQATATTNTSPSPDPDNDFAVYFDTISGDYKILWNMDPGKSPPAAGVDYEMSIRPGSGDYEYARNKVYLEEDNAASNANSVLAQLGFMIEDPMFTGSYIFDPANVNNAVDAIVKINGVTITVPDNEISADSDSGELIPNVKLELLGIGHVVMNITQDASGAVEAMEKFVEEYNNVMTLINDRLSEKYTQSSASADDDYLQSLLSESKSSTVFGVLHGDQLLWSIKNQLRNMITNSISTLSSSIRSRKVQHPNAPIDMKGSFYINSGGNVARIDVVPTDTLEDIERKLKFSTSINGYGTAQAKVDMGLDVSISNGQLVIKRPSSVALTDTRNDTLTRSGGDFAYLDYVPELSPPIGGKLTIVSGETTFVENEDYRLNAFENENGVMESRIEWISGGRSPMVGDTYNVEYTYNPSAVSYSLVPSNAITSDPLESYLYNLSFLDLHQDMGKVQLSTYGITTESLDYGKSGLLEFDSQVFFEAIVEDSKQVSNVMVSFMKGLDSYIDNLASSSQVTVGGAVITKGRINAAMNNIDTEVLALQEQIDKLESQLAQRQETMYKQFTNMELAIQKLNAQMSSVSQYLSMNTNSSSSS